jgi:hypothetical protein
VEEILCSVIEFDPRSKVNSLLSVDIMLLFMKIKARCFRGEKC